jgi:hypothetical protein
LLVGHPARVRPVELDFLRPVGPAPDRLAATIARLAALVGPENVGAPRAEDTWREEAVSLAPYPLGGGNDSAAPPASAAPPPGARPLVLRRFRPPEEIEVMLGPAGPAALRGKDTTARILIAAGPYRFSGEWWRPHGAAASGNDNGGGGGHASGNDNSGNARFNANDNSGGADELGFSRDCWDVHASDGAVYRLHEDRRTGRWFLDGYYD